MRHVTTPSSAAWRQVADAFGWSRRAPWAPTTWGLSFVLLGAGPSWSAPAGSASGTRGPQATEEVVCEWYSGGISAMSPDCRRVAVMDVRRVVRLTQVEWQPQMVVDGVPPRQRYRCTAGARFSPDSKRVAYVGGDGDSGRDLTGAHVIVDGVEGPRHPRVRAASCAFSPDSKHLAYVYEENKQYRLVVDGEVRATCDEIGDTTWVPDSSGLVYAAKRQGKWVPVSTSGEGPEYDEVGVVMALDAAGAKVAYTARSGRKWRVYLDGTPGPEFDAIGSVAARSRAAAEGGNAAAGTTVIAYEAKVGKEWVVMPRTGPEETWSEVQLVGIYDQGVPLYAAKRGKSWRYAFGAWQSSEHEQVGRVRPGLEAGRTAYEARDGKEWRVVTGSEPGPAFEAVEIVGGAYEGPVRYVAVRDGNLYWVRGAEAPVPISVASGCRYRALLRFLTFDGSEVRGLATRVPQNRGSGSKMTEIVRLCFTPEAK